MKHAIVGDDEHQALTARALAVQVRHVTVCEWLVHQFGVAEVGVGAHHGRVGVDDIAQHRAAGPESDPIRRLIAAVTAQIPKAILTVGVNRTEHICVEFGLLVRRQSGPGELATT